MSFSNGSPSLVSALDCALESLEIAGACWAHAPLLVRLVHLDTSSIRRQYQRFRKYQEAINSFDKHLLSTRCGAGTELIPGDTALN